jgi:hypothetical protein
MMNRTSKTAKDLEVELRKSASLLSQLRDEIRVDLHLAGMDAKSEWNRLEPRLEAAIQRATRDVSDATETAIKEVTDAARRLRDTLVKK